MTKQRTLKHDVLYEGVGLHSGLIVHLRLCPAEINTGVVFQRVDLDGTVLIPAVAQNVTSTLRATTLEANGAKVFTVEHLMGALHAFGIDNCRIEIDAEEPPVADGAAEVFCTLLAEAGTVEQEAEARFTTIDQVYRVEREEAFVLALPYEGFRVSFTSINPHPLVGIQYFDALITRENFQKEIAPARTIAYAQEIEVLRNMGLGLGGTLENVIVYDDDAWMNSLRFPDELVRHKILDVVGDLRLAGKIRGHIIAVASGHALNTALAKEIAKIAL